MCMCILSTYLVLEISVFICWPVGRTGRVFLETKVFRGKSNLIELHLDYIEADFHI